MAYLSTTRISQGKAKQVAWVRIPVHFERREASGMALNRLRHFSFGTVKLHRPNNTLILNKLQCLSNTLKFFADYLGGNPDQKQEFSFSIRSVIDDLCALQSRMPIKHFQAITLKMEIT